MRTAAQRGSRAGRGTGMRALLGGMLPRVATCRNPCQPSELEGIKTYSQFLFSLLPLDVLILHMSIILKVGRGEEVLNGIGESLYILKRAHKRRDRHVVGGGTARDWWATLCAAARWRGLPQLWTPP